MSNMSELEPVACDEHPLSRFSAEEVDRIVRVKRFFELIHGAKDFREAFDKGSFSAEQRAYVQEIGIDFDLDELALFWEDEEFQNEIAQMCCAKPRDISPGLTDKLAGAPLVALWLRYMHAKKRTDHAQQTWSFSVPRSPRFNAWRTRRIASTVSELGYFGHYIDHPIIAIELTDGCSKGCWFCGFAAKKLSGVLEYPDNREYFRGVATSLVELFGANEAAMTLLYYGTEPHDNPHYTDYLKEFADITGHLTCTATAAPAEADWIRGLLALYREQQMPWPRMSVLTRKMLDRIHRLYTPDELRYVEMVMQMKDESRAKVSGGRILEEQGGMRERDDGEYLDQIVPQGSIACVTGFLINLLNKTIEVVSPCYSSEKWPLGYRVYDSASFTDASDFKQKMETLIARGMALSPPPDAIARFRDDLRYKATEAGFDLVSPNQIHHFTGQSLWGPLGALVAEGQHSFRDIGERLMSRGDIHFMLVGSALAKLFDGGFIDEVGMRAPD